MEFDIPHYFIQSVSTTMGMFIIIIKCNLLMFINRETKEHNNDCIIKQNWSFTIDYRFSLAYRA